MTDKVEWKVEALTDGRNWSDVTSYVQSLNINIGKPDDVDEFESYSIKKWSMQLYANIKKKLKSRSDSFDVVTILIYVYMEYNDYIYILQPLKFPFLESLS